MPYDGRHLALATLAGAGAGAVACVALSRWWVRTVASNASGGLAASSSTEAVQAGRDVCVDGRELRAVIEKCLQASGAAAEYAVLVADVLVAADERGIPSHGVNRCEIYCAELAAGLIDGSAEPVAVEGRNGPSTCLVDGRNALGAVVSRFAMRRCIEMAKATGVGIASCRNSNHFGIAGYWASMALREGLLGMSFTNTAPWVIPSRASKRACGTNPVCCFAPGAHGDSFQLDMATSAVPVGKVEVMHRKHQPVPTGWGVDRHGLSTHSATEIIQCGGLLPVGGLEVTAGYKGYGLSMLVEILCATLSGCDVVGPSVPPWTATRGCPNDYGQCFVCIDPARFAPGFEERLTAYLDAMRTLPRCDPLLPVLVPGDPEKAEEAASARRGVRLNEAVAASVRRLASRLEVPVPAVLRDTHVENELDSLLT